MTTYEVANSYDREWQGGYVSAAWNSAKPELENDSNGKGSALDIVIIIRGSATDGGAPFAKLNGK